MGEITPFSCFPVINFQLTNPKPKFLISVTASNQVYFPISLQRGFLILFHRLDSDLSLTNLNLSYPPLSLSCTICSFLPSMFSLHMALYFHLIHSCCPYTSTWTWGMFLNLISHSCKDCALHNSRRCHYAAVCVKGAPWSCVWKYSWLSYIFPLLCQTQASLLYGHQENAVDRVLWPMMRN